jgi:hypothetical protein
MKLEDYQRVILIKCDHCAHVDAYYSNFRNVMMVLADRFRDEFARSWIQGGY